MNVSTSTLMRRAAVPVVALGIAAGGSTSALADPPGQPHDYFAPAAAPTRPDNRAGIRGPSSTVMLYRREADSSSSIGWRNAGIGAGGAVAIALVAAGTLTIRRQTRRREAQA